MKEKAWVAEQDDWFVALAISILGSIFLFLFIAPLTNLFFNPPTVFPLLITGGIGFLTYRIRTSPKTRLEFRKGRRVFEYQKELGAPLKPARFDQIVELSVIAMEEYQDELSSNSFTLEDYWKTQLVLEIREMKNRDGESIGEDLRMVIPGSAMNYENFLKQLINWGLVEQGSGSTLLTFRIFPNHK